MLGWRDHRIEHTRIWSLDRPLSLQVMWRVPYRWQCENLMFVVDGTLTAASHNAPKCGACGGMNFQSHPSLVRSPVSLPPVIRREACKFHEVHLKHLGSWYHCLHDADAVSSWMVATLLPTNVFHLFGGPCIHVSTMEESVQR